MGRGPFRNSPTSKSILSGTALTELPSVMDSEYLKSTVGSALTAAMSALVVEQPDDSVEVSCWERPSEGVALYFLP